MAREGADVARPEKKRKSRQRARMGFFTGMVLLALIAALGLQLRHLRNQVETAQTEQQQLAAQVRRQQQENGKLQEDIDNGGTQERMEEIAREELGMVAPGDRVFYDVSN